MDELSKVDKENKRLREKIDVQMKELAVTLTDLANSMYGSPGKSKHAAIVLYSLAGALRDDERAVEELARIAGEFSKEMIAQHKRLDN